MLPAVSEQAIGGRFLAGGGQGDEEAGMQLPFGLGDGAGGPGKLRLGLVQAVAPLAVVGGAPWLPPELEVDPFHAGQLGDAAGREREPVAAAVRLQGGGEED